MKRKIAVGAIMILCFLLQSTLFQALSFASISPNLLIIVVSSYGFMRGKKEGMIIGFLSGLLMDIFFGPAIGFYALIYMYIGYCNGFFRKLFFPDEIKLPLMLISVSDLVCNLLIYFFLFLFRGKFEFSYYLVHIMIPELVYTMLVTVVLYFIILRLDQRLEKSEKRSAGKSV
ncbi:MAG: rod shape-determining protein MreD [Lachnospiraceae bacterium]